MEHNITYIILLASLISYWQELDVVSNFMAEGVKVQNLPFFFSVL